MKKVVKKDVFKVEKESKLDLFLPQEIHLLIFSFLEVEDLLLVSLVNSDWYKLSISDFIWKKLTNRPSLDEISASWKHFYISLTKPKFQKSKDFLVSKDGLTCSYKPKGIIQTVQVESKLNIFRNYYFEFQLLSFDSDSCWICYGIQFDKDMNSWMGFATTKGVSSFYNQGEIYPLKAFEIDQMDTLSLYLTNESIYFYLNAELLVFDWILNMKGREWVPFIAFSSANQEMKVKINNPFKYKKLTKKYFQKQELEGK